ncbi:MAG: exo-alpha-sialidase [Bacteroidia bacterium]|nr:exo-alpha-sialidase [Bacteroidia bacterium]
MRITILYILLTAFLQGYSQFNYNISDTDSLFVCHSDTIILSAHHSFPYVKPDISDIQPSLVDSDHTAEGFMVTLSDGSIVHFFRLDPGFWGDHTGNTGRIVKRISYDNGNTWQPNEPVYDDTLWDDRNVHGGLIGKDSVVLFFRKYNATFAWQIGLFYIYSFDGGQTWSELQTINTIPNGTFGTNKIVKIPGVGFLASISGAYYVELRLSLDGIDWHNMLYVWDYTLGHEYYFGESCFTYLGNGKLIGLIRNSTQTLGSTYYQVTSSDYGQTWTEPASTNIAQPYFCPAPIIFYDTLHQDIWSIATDRRNLVGYVYNAYDSQVWVYRNKTDDVFANPTNYTLEMTMLRPEPSYYRFYGYPTYTRTSNGNYLVVFTDCYKKPNNLEDADFFQFHINYDTLISESSVYEWNNGSTSETIAPDTSGIYIATASDNMGNSYTDSIFFSRIRTKIKQKNMTVFIDSLITLSSDNIASIPGYHYHWSTGDTIPSIQVSPHVNSIYYLNVNNGIFSCNDSVIVRVKLRDPGNDTFPSSLIINTLSEQNRIVVAPNPFSSGTVVYFYNPDQYVFSLMIYDLYGKLLRETTGIMGESVTIRKENLVSGMYYLVLADNEGDKLIAKVVVQ